LKFARASTKKERIVAAMRGFHGKTFGALSATWSPEYRDAFGPLVPGFVHARFNDVADLDAKIDDRTAAVILECVQGEGGVRPADADYLRHAERLCRERGALLVIDEVQTGFGRTGKYLAIEHFGIAPDVVCLAKSVAGGVPMGVVAFSRSLGDLPKRSHTSTFGGNPLACAAGVAAIGVLLGERLVQNAAARGTELIAGLRSVRSEKVREVRGLGLMVGVEVREPAGPTLRRMADEGVLALAAGPTVVRFLPPLCITAEQVDRAVRAFAEAVAP
jgi:acetylornithine/LysW-gamma-L-lysine aminotransferase